MRIYLYLGLLGLLFMQACSSPHPSEGGNGDEQFSPMQYAGLFAIAQGKDSSTLYYIEGKDSIRSIRRPKRAAAMPRVVLLSSVFAGFAEALDARSAVAGIDNIRYISDSLLRAMHGAGQVAETGEEGQLNLQTILRLKPDFIIGSSLLYEDKALRERLQRNGIQVLKCDNFKEQHPLARAEWIKFFGFLFNRQQAADSLFRQIEASYLRQAVESAGLKDKPLVLTDALYMDAWNVPGGASYTAKLIEDAGGLYVFKDMRDLNTYPLNLETVLRKGGNADIWLHVNTYRTRSEMLLGDARYTLFKAFGKGRVFNNNKRENSQGGNDFWETGVLRPDLVLADLKLIFSGAEFSADKLYFYTRVD